MKRFVVYLLSIVFAISAGHYLGKACEDGSEFISWLSKSLDFGMDVQNINMNVFQIAFGFHISINYMQILFIILALVAAPAIIKSIK